MNLFEKILYMLQAEMNEPESFGWFHLLWIGLTLLSIFILFMNRKKYSEKQLKTVLGVYGVIALILEIIKQFIWSFNYDNITGVITWDYQWYAAPFQFCTTPIYVSLICLFLKNNKFRESLLAYLSFFTIIGSFMTIIIPDSCFVKTIEVNIHTMWLHCGSFVVSIYLMLVGAVRINKNNLFNGFKVFIIFVILASILNVSIYNIGILNGETFNMFYISPYFISELPVFDIIQQNVPYIIYLLLYIIAIFGAAFIVYGVATLSKKCYNLIRK